MKALKKIIKQTLQSKVCQDTPDSADNYRFELSHGDIILSATDGVFDNLFQYEIL